MRNARHRTPDGTPPHPDPWTEADRTIASRSAEGTFLGAEVPERHIDQIREGLERARLAGVFLDAPPFMAVTRGPEHRIVNVTPSVYRIVGPRRLVGVSAREAFPELSDDPYLNLLDRVFQTGQTFEIGLEPIRIYAEPGDPEAGFQQRWTSFAYRPLTGSEGDIHGVLITGVDATEKIRERRALEARVRQQETVARLSAHALTHPGLDHLAPEVVRSASAVLDVESVALLAARNPGSGPTVFDVLARAGPDHAPDEIPAAGLLESRVLDSTEPIHVRDGRDGRLADHPLAGPGGFASAVLVPVPDPDGESYAVLGAYGTEPDRFEGTDRHFLEGLANTLAAARRRHESDRFQATLLQNLPGIVYRCRQDREWTMEFLSTGVRDLTGYAAGELRENQVLSWADLIHPEDRDRVWREVNRAVAEDVPFQLQYRIRRRDGEIRWVWEQGRAVERTGSPPRLEGYIFDITESRSAREELREARSLLMTTFQSIQEAVLVVDSEDRTILACNPAVTKITGYSREDLLGRSTETLHLDRASFEEFGRWSERVLERDEVFRGEFQLRRKDGCVIPTEHLISYLENDHDAEEPALVSVVRDLSERKMREQEVRANRRRLQSLSRKLLQVREEERARISRHLHDVVGQTLTAVKFGLDALEDDLGGPGASEELGRARELVSESLRQIRDLSVELRPAVLDDLGLLPAIRWYLDRLEDRVDFGLELAVGSGVAEADVSDELQTQAFRITQEALMNTARHAEASRVLIDVRTEDGDLVVTVRDDGRGFDLDRLRDGTAGEQQLGLLGMEERASLVDGSLHLDSDPGEGTTVRFRAPLETRTRARERIPGANGPGAEP